MPLPLEVVANPQLRPDEVKLGVASVIGDLPPESSLHELPN